MTDESRGQPVCDHTFGPEEKIDEMVTSYASPTTGSITYGRRCEKCGETFETRTETDMQL